LPAPDPGPAALIQGDALHLPLADESVDLIVTSPPYFGLRSYTDQGEHYAGQLGSEPTPAGFLAALWAATAEMKRVLKPGGSIFVNLGDRYAGGGQGGHTGATLDQSDTYRATRAAGYSRAKKAEGVRDKSLMLLPEAYRLGCTGMLAALGRDYVHRELAAQVTKALLRDVATGWLTLADAEAAIDLALDPAVSGGLLGGPDPGLNLIARSVIVWAKPNGLPESVQDRIRRSHEDWVHLVKQPRYYSAVDEIRENYSPGAHARYKAGAGRNPKLRELAATHAHIDQDGLNGNTRNPLGKLPGSVWSVPSEPLRVPPELGVDHYAAFPSEWPRRLILGFSPPGGVILDPFAGTGTTVMASRALGRHGVGVDLSADYLRLAAWRVWEGPGVEKVRDRTWPPPPKRIRRIRRTQAAADDGVQLRLVL
jgi:DNA modification methylase